MCQQRFHRSELHICSRTLPASLRGRGLLRNLVFAPPFSPTNEYLENGVDCVRPIRVDGSVFGRTPTW